MKKIPAAAAVLATGLMLGCGAQAYQTNYPPTQATMDRFLAGAQLFRHTGDPPLTRYLYHPSHPKARSLKGQRARQRRFDRRRVGGDEKNIEQQQMFFEYDVRFTSRNMACNVIDSIATVAGVKKVRVA